MGFGLDVVTKVDSIEDKGDHYTVKVELDRNAKLPNPVKKVRARARAMVATGLVENAGNRTRDIARAVKNVRLGEINRSTEVVTETRNTVTVKVNKR